MHLFDYPCHPRNPRLKIKTSNSEPRITLINADWVEARETPAFVGLLRKLSRAGGAAGVNLTLIENAEKASAHGAALTEIVA